MQLLASSAAGPGKPPQHQRREERVPLSMAAGPASVTLETDGPVTSIVFDRAAVRNALNQETWRALADRLDEVASAGDAVRVVLLRSTGSRAFVAGADIKELDEIRRSPLTIRTYVGLIESVMKRLEQLPQPVIAVVSGDAIGAGLELMAACDLRIAQRGARFGIPAARLGLAITGQDLHRLERLVGLGRAKWLLMTGQLIDTSTALDWGVIEAIHHASELDSEGLALAHLVAANSALTNRLTKQALLTYTDPVRSGEEQGLACALPAWSGQSLAEGIASFLERRPPDFVAVERLHGA